MKKLFTVILSLVLFPLCVIGQQKKQSDSLVEVSGVVMTADSLRQIPGVSIFVKGHDRGTVANDDGVFTIVIEKGDTLVFRVIGFKRKQVIVPFDYSGHFMGLAVPMTQDTTYLPPAIVHSYPSREEFADAFLHWKIPNSLYELAKSNTSPEKLRSAMYFTPPDGGEGVSNTFRSRREFMQSKGQMPTMNIFNPLAWAQFIKALKDGDFKRKD